MVECTTNPHMRSVATVLASTTMLTGQGPKSEREVRNSAKNPSKHTTVERFSYMREAQQVFEDATVVGLVCDAVHIGDQDWLNCFLWTSQQQQGYICPPQAHGVGHPLHTKRCLYEKELLRFLFQGQRTAGGPLFATCVFSSSIPAPHFPPVSPLRFSSRIRAPRKSTSIPA